MTEHSTNGPGFGATETISGTTEHSTNGPGFGTTETISETTVSATPISASPSTTYLSDVSSTSTQTISATVLDKTQSDSNIATSSLDDVSGVYTITSTESASGSLQSTAVSTCQSSTSFDTDSCCCVCAPLYQDTTANIANILEEFRQILTVDRASLSSTYRRKHSMADNRNTSVYMGCVAIVILVVVLVTIIFLDLSHFLFRR
ncbi:uncharacterized protein LOC132552293 [Ylistrum balloti]|uniref:uncharacterized protein LOC132552293 n=1 Tax=Ylistrum balloti TaxID=509963 RepID=UPI0029057FAA|nr:uncharacterized protein LOC132552293 [Ylistrum balloti]